MLITRIKLLSETDTSKGLIGSGQMSEISMNTKAKDFMDEYIYLLKTTNTTKNLEVCEYIWVKVIKDWTKELIRKDKKSIWIKSYVGKVMEYKPLRVTFDEDGMICWFGNFISDTEYVRFMDYGKTWSFDKEDLENGKNN